MKYVAACLLVLAVACGGSDGGPPAPDASRDIDGSGGTVAVQQGALSGAAIEVPANAVPATTNFTIRAGADIDAGAGTTNVGPAVRFGPAVTAFQTAITVTLPYSPGQAGGSAVRIVQRDDVTGGLTFHNNPTVDARNGLVSVATMRFSTFQAFIGPEAATFDMTGFWTVSSSNQFSNPPGDEDVDGTFLAEVDQTGNSVTMDVQDGTADPESMLSGTVDGADYSLTGGTDTVAFTLTDADTGSGTVRWSEDGVSGGADLTLGRQRSATFDVAGDWNLTFSNNQSNPPGNEGDNETVAFIFTQAGTTWTLTADADTRSGFLSGSSYFAAWVETNEALNEVEVFLELTFTDEDNGTGRILALEELPDESIIRRTADITATRQP